MTTPLWLLYHVPKTGGQTIRDHLTKYWRRGIDFDHLGRWDRAAPLSIDDIERLAPTERDELRLLSGHPVNRELTKLFPGRTVRELVMIRDPARRTISHYNFSMTMRTRRGEPVVSFEEFVENLGVDFMTRFLARRVGHQQRIRALDAVLYELSQFWLVVRTEQLDTFLPMLLDDLGLPPVVPERTNVTGSTIDRYIDPEPQLLAELRERNPCDMMLYRAVEHLEAAYLERRRQAEGSRSLAAHPKRWYST